MLTALLLVLNLLLAVHRPDSEKLSSYECGFSPVFGQTRTPFSVQFLLIAILFLIFDLEIILFYPAAVVLYEISTYGFFIAMGFFLVLTVGFIFEFSKGALKFTDQRSSLTIKSPIKL